MGLPERANARQDIDPCDVSQWLRVAPKAAKRHLRNGMASGSMSGWSAIGTPSILSDTWEVEAVVAVVKDIKKDMCPECPQAECPTEKIMRYLNDAPLKRGAEIVIGKFFEEPTSPSQPSAPPALNP